MLLKSVILSIDILQNCTPYKVCIYCELLTDFIPYFYNFHPVVFQDSYIGKMKYVLND